jgi:hypothetical protein
VVLSSEILKTNEDTSYLIVGILPQVSFTAWRVVKSHPHVVSHLLLLPLLHDVDSLASLSLLRLRRLNVRVQRLLHARDGDSELA